MNLYGTFYTVCVPPGKHSLSYHYYSASANRTVASGGARRKTYSFGVEKRYYLSSKVRGKTVKYTMSNTAAHIGYLD